MDFQARVMAISSKLNTFLRQYQPPPNLDNEGRLAEIRATAEEINFLISASSNQESLAARVDDCFRQIRRTYSQRTWPTTSHFVKAMEATSRAVQTPVSSEPLDDLKIIAAKMSAGEAVGDGWLFGRNAVRLLRSGLVTTDQVRKYRSALFFSARDVGGKEYADRIEAELIERHDAGVAIEREHADAS